MKIGVDIRCLMDGSRTGVEEYTIEILKRLLNKDKKNEYILFINSFKEIEADLSWLEKFNNVTIKNYGFPNKLFNFLMWFLRWPKVDILLGGVDVFFMPNISFVALSKKCKLVLTMHDLSFERHPEFFSPKRRLWHFILNPRKLCERANKILAVSDSTKRDLITVYGMPKEKINKAFSVERLSMFEKINKPDDRLIEEIDRIRGKYKLPEKFVLFLGTIEPRKNVISIVKAFEIFKKDNINNQKLKNLKLVIAGVFGWSYEETKKAIEESEFADDILITGFVEDNDKPYLYRLAEVLVYPSFFEGFGFPPAEAMASGTPVVTSNCSSLPEVARDGAILIDPYRPDEIIFAFQNIFGDDELREELVRKGRIRTEKLIKESGSFDFLEILTG